MICPLLADSAPLRGLLTGEQNPTTLTDVAWVVGYLLTAYGLAFYHILWGRDGREQTPPESDHHRPPTE